MEPIELPPSTLPVSAPASTSEKEAKRPDFSLPPLALPPRCTVLLGFVALGLVAYLLGVYVIELNTAFYQTHAPFFDSCAYYTQMAHVIMDTHQFGVLKSIPITTNALPWIEVSVLYKLFPHEVTVTRATALWLQMTWALPLMFSVYFYMHVLRRLDALTSFAATLPFVAFPALFFYNGGLTDFRMDLSLYLFFSLTAVWYLATSMTDRWYPWIFVGLAAGITCLARATAPVYLIVSLGPPLLVRLILSPQRKRLLIGAAMAGVIAAITCLWFYIRNHDYLYFYYVVWNQDANAHLPFAEAKEHFWIAWDNLGQRVRTFCLVLGAAVFLTDAPRAMGLRLRHPLRLLGDINWAALYIGIAPAAMLILRGAGLNPFVSMPSCFGLMMFPLAFDARPLTHRRPYWIGWVLASYAVVLSVSIAVHGMENHTAPPSVSSMASHRAVIDTMLVDAEAHHNSKFTFAGTHLLYLYSPSLSNVMMFEYGFELLSDDELRRGDFDVTMNHYYQVSTQVEFDRYPGNTHEERMAGLVKTANDSVAYMTFPDETTLKYVETTIDRYYANVICREFRDKLLASGHWEKIGSPIVVSQYETVQLYANRGLKPEAPSSPSGPWPATPSEASTSSTPASQPAATQR